MNNSLVNDAISLCQTIYDATPPTTKWRAVSIAKTINRIFSYPSVPEIPTGYGYFYDEVPKYLFSEGVFEAMVPNKWYKGIISVSSGTKINDLVSTTAIAKGYLERNQLIDFYSKWRREYVDFGPTAPGQFTVLVNIESLLRFIATATSSPLSQTPAFDNKTGELSFLGEKIMISGDIEIRSLDLLVKNLNSIVSKADFYEVRDNVNYQKAIKGKKATNINDITEKIFRALKLKVKANDKLKKVLVFAQDEGFGIFVDQNQLQKVTSPQ